MGDRAQRYATPLMTAVGQIVGPPPYAGLMEAEEAETAEAARIADEIDHDIAAIYSPPYDGPDTPHGTPDKRCPTGSSQRWPTCWPVEHQDAVDYMAPFLPDEGLPVAAIHFDTTGRRIEIGERVKY